MSGKLKGALFTIFIIVVTMTVSLLVPYKEDKRVVAGTSDTDIDDFERFMAEDQIILHITEADKLSNINRDKTVDEQQSGYLLKENGSVYWEFDVEKSDYYYISAGYLPMDGNGQNIGFGIYLDGNDLSAEQTITLTRLWIDSGVFAKTSNGDEVRPKQMELFTWMEEKFKYNSKDDVKFYLEKGKHSIEIINRKESCKLQYIRIFSENIPEYEEYLAEQSKELEYSGYFEQVEAELTYRKSSPELYQTYDKSSPYTSPYHPSEIRYNTIGGSNWKKGGQWIEWKISVPSDGYYQIGMRFRQDKNKGVISTRTITIDGAKPFAELENIQFPYSIHWQTKYVGDDTPYLFYLTKGEHILRMEVVLGELSELIAEMEETVNRLNSVYRDIIMITGTQPDIYRDYNLEQSIPGLMDNLVSIISELSDYEEYLEQKYGEGSYASRIISQLKRQLESFVSKPYTIQKRLSVFKTNISSMAEWVISFSEQPLELDCFYITGAGYEIPKAETTIFGKLGHEIRAFLGSFVHDYSTVSSDHVNNDAVTIQVWIGRGRDQANIIKRLVDEYFTKETGIHVNLSLVEGALVKAAIAGQGPDINLFTSRGEAMNLAFRGALTPVNELEGFSDLKKEYMENAFVPYEYEGSVYAVPEEQIFYMMFVRKDVLSNLRIDIPQTWNDLMKAIPVLQASNLQIGLPYTDGYATMNSGIGTINILPTLLAQTGINIYNKDKTATLLASGDAYQAFKMWTDFYTKYDFPLYKDDFNRFRTGEMPIVIAPYTLYNTLLEAAPEIQGQWEMTTIPGTIDTQGNRNIATSASGSCSIILKDCDEKQAAWKFLQWWNSAEIQAMYSKEIEVELGILGRYTPANLKAFDQTNWYEEEKAVLLKQWNSVVEVPEIPGGYYTSRNIDNAFRAVYYNGENARESMYYWMNAINEELSRKVAQLEARKEY